MTSSLPAEFATEDKVRRIVETCRSIAKHGRNKHAAAPIVLITDDMPAYMAAVRSFGNELHAPPNNLWGQTAYVDISTPDGWQAASIVYVSAITRSPTETLVHEVSHAFTGRTCLHGYSWQRLFIKSLAACTDAADVDLFDLATRLVRRYTEKWGEDYTAEIRDLVARGESVRDGWLDL